MFDPSPTTVCHPAGRRDRRDHPRGAAPCSRPLASRTSRSSCSPAACRRQRGRGPPRWAQPRVLLHGRDQGVASSGVLCWTDDGKSRRAPSRRVEADLDGAAGCWRRRAAGPARQPAHAHARCTAGGSLREARRKASAAVAARLSSRPPASRCHEVHQGLSRRREKLPCARPKLVKDASRVLHSASGDLGQPQHGVGR